jgi:hypothetical protein
MPSPQGPSLLAVSLALALAGVVLGGCGEGPSAATTPAKTPAAVGATRALGAPQAPPGHVLRPEVNRVLVQQGPSWVLRRVMREETFGKDGRFAGWRITGLPEEWRPIDLRPGDVVTRVNGKALETPEEAWDAWKSVAGAREIKLALLRDGAPRELVIPIDGDPSADAIRALEQDTPPPRRAPKKEPRGVVQIGGSEPPAGDFENDTY